MSTVVLLESKLHHLTSEVGSLDDPELILVCNTGCGGEKGSDDGDMKNPQAGVSQAIFVITHRISTIEKRFSEVQSRVGDI